MIYLKAGALLVFVLGLVVIGWKANGWRIDAAKAEGYRLELRNELQRRVAADAARLDLQRKLETAKARVEIKTQEVIKKVKVYVPSNRDCDLNDDVVRLLNDARAGGLSSTAPVTATTSRSAGPKPDPASTPKPAPSN